MCAFALLPTKNKNDGCLCWRQVEKLTTCYIVKQNSWSSNPVVQIDIIIIKM